MLFRLPPIFVEFIDFLLLFGLFLLQSLRLVLRQIDARRGGAGRRWKW